MKKAQVGIIGLGVMGANLALNMAENGYSVAIFNRTVTKVDSFLREAGQLQERFIPCRSLSEFVASIEPPRPIFLLLKAGDAVDEQIEHLVQLTSACDIIVDAGNADFHDTIRRNRELQKHDVEFVGLGISGGEEGARHGPSMMAGASRNAYARLEQLLRSISAKHNSSSCVTLVGPNGAGHFVKTVHNGIEYADMQLIAEAYGYMRDGLCMKPDQIARAFRNWNDGNLRSYLMEVSSLVLETLDETTGEYLVDVIEDSAGQKGTGRWAAIEAQKLGVPATIIDCSVALRSLSARRAERQSAASIYRDNESVVSKAPNACSLEALEQGLLVGKICAYAQGFAILAAASRNYGWELPLADIARVWRAGCIIRADLLDLIESALRTNPGIDNLLLSPMIAPLLKHSVPSLRKVIGSSALAGIPMPAFGAVLGYLDSYSSGRGTANMIQAQRDFFGAHGFSRLDASGEHHGPWGTLKARI